MAERGPPPLRTAVSGPPHQEALEAPSSSSSVDMQPCPAAASSLARSCTLQAVDEANVSGSSLLHPTSDGHGHGGGLHPT